MQINLIVGLFILDSEKNTNIRKNDIKKIKVLVNTNDLLPTFIYDSKNMKTQLRKNLSKAIGSDIFHIEQVFTLENKDSIDVLYLGITNIENVSKLDRNYKLIDFNVKDNSLITFGDSTITYKTIENEEFNNIEYIHEIDTKDLKIKNTLLRLLICYKKIRSTADNTDTLFKFMGSSFTLEDVRIVYELIKDTTVDKSNFRKKIIKYCEEVEEKDNTKTGFRPSQKYRFKPLKGDVWL